MDSEERPRKLPKLGHDGEEETVHSELGPAMTGAVSATEEPQNTAVSSIEDGNKDATAQETEKDAEAKPDTVTSAQTNDDGTPKLSKNQLKKIRKREKWEQERDLRKTARKEKAAAKKVQRKALYDEARATGGEEAVQKLSEAFKSNREKRKKSTLLPFTIIMDCGYDDLMHPGERTSLAGQLTRSYSDNTRAPWRANLMFSSFDKLLKHRFDTILAPYKNWKGIKIIQEDFVEAAEIAKQFMVSPRGGQLVGPFADKPDAKPEDGEVIYLSSDSENTLTELKPYHTYIIGGLVDKNRHKAICYKSAVEKGLKTAKLPIGDYIQMASRQVLTTNHVAEIMLRWLECGDWGEAFLKVLPSRKGGVLRGQSKDDGDDEKEEQEENDEPDNEEDQIAAVQAAADDDASEDEA